MLDTHAAGVLAKLHTGRHVKQYGVKDDLLWFQTKRKLHGLYIPASFRTEALRKVHNHALAVHETEKMTVERSLGPHGGLECG